ncbi:MAG: hypothetical protein KA297_11840 [Kofleriaceae bacterium]|jgi:hypothetical protein|nr:hypothetical protein [Kofleriaceae bacterium]MBP6837942.1 hypothetical protein [Kofleriaceae bacterium]
MGGCTNCAGKAGCDDHKGAMMGSIEQHLRVLYPTGRWDELAVAAAVAPLGDDELAGLASELATELDAVTWVRAGGDDDLCDYIYVLALGRPPCALRVRDDGDAVPAEWHGLPRVDERYLRLAVSQLAPVAAVQEVAVEVEVGVDGVVIHERPQAGVYAPALLARLQRLVALLPAYGLTHLDFGDLITPPPGFDGATFAARWGLAPATYQYLLFAPPATTSSAVWLPAPAAWAGAGLSSDRSTALAPGAADGLAAGR